MRRRYEFMLAEKANYPLTMMARKLEVSRSGFYQWLERAPKKDTWADARFEVKHIWKESKGRMGARSIQASLSRTLTLYRMRKLMTELGICSVQARSKVVTTIPAKDKDTRPDLVCRHFCPPVATTVLAGDITCLKTAEGWLYLASVIDLATRMVVGWCFSERMEADIVVSAIEMAYRRGYVAENAIFHSDRGSQYTSRKMAEWARTHKVRLSVGRTGSCHDNAVAESFWSRLKVECFDRSYHATRDDAKWDCLSYIEGYYNRRRPHSTIGWRIPGEVMDEFKERIERTLSEKVEDQAA